MASIPSNDAAVRQAILRLLRADGPQLAAHLANTLTLSAADVREHLYALMTEGKVEWSPARGGMPAKMWAIARGARAEASAAEQTAGCPA